MLHTAEQATSLWCPLVRHDGDNGGSFNTGHRRQTDPLNTAGRKNDHYTAGCIANQCAMWRWAGPAPRSTEMLARAVGYCGLAGRPGVAA